MNTKQVSDFFIKCVEKNRIPHAFIVHGGNTAQRRSVSITAAKILECEKTPDICENCYHCRAISSDNHPDVSRVQPEKRNLSIDEVRAIKEKMYMKPYCGKYRIFIIETDWMQAPAANSLLKILEEPPEYGIMIVLARNNKNFLPTIVSRAINLRINPEMETPEENKEIVDQIRELIESAAVKDWKNFFNTSATLAKRVSREEFEDVFELIVMFARQKLLQSAGIEELKSAHLESIMDVKQHSQIAQLLDKRTYLRFNVNSRIILERMVLELTQPKWRNWQTR